MVFVGYIYVKSDFSAKTCVGSVHCQCSRRVPYLKIYVFEDHRPPFIVSLKLSSACTAPENSDEESERDKEREKFAMPQEEEEEEEEAWEVEWGAKQMAELFSRRVTVGWLSS